MDEASGLDDQTSQSDAANVLTAAEVQDISDQYDVPIEAVESVADALESRRF